METNSPANEYWTLYFLYTFQNASQSQKNISVSFLATGEIDMRHTCNSDLENIKNLLEPTVNLLKTPFKNYSFDSFDGMRLLNFLVVSNYWLYLWDFGQIAPTTYNTTPQGLLNFSQQNIYAPTNNIFVNDTLFQIYSDYLHNSLIPLLRNIWSDVNLPLFLPLNYNNRLQPVSTPLIRSYSCQERRMKGWLSVIIAVLAANYALLGFAYTVYIFIAGRLQRPQDTQSSS